MEELDIKMINILLLFLFIITLSSCAGAATEFRVNSSGSIQDVLTRAHSGDTIIVSPGTYNENVDISRQNDLNNLVLMSESGNPADTQIVGKKTDKDVIVINNENAVTVKGFTISGAGTGKAGISLNGGKNCIIENNILSNDDIGINIDNSPNNAVRKNVVTRTGVVNTSKGIVISGSDNYDVSDNSISNQYLGIQIKYSVGGNISGNNVTQSGNHGIMLDGADSATLERNIVDSVTMFGIYVDETNQTVVRNNTVLNRNSVGNGINLLFSDWNKIEGNTVSLSNHALFMNNSHYNTLQDNIIPDSAYGIAMRYSENNSIVNNSAYNDISGIYLTHNSGNNTISGNKANLNIKNGIELHLSAHDNILNNNEVSQNQMNGIYIVEGAHDNILDNNEVNQNQINGIYFEEAINNEVSNNKVTENKEGISFISSRKNTISGNNINGNELGIYLCAACYPNDIYNNYFNNTKNADVGNAGCTWYLQPPTKGKNIVNGPSLGGNFWATPGGAGFSETASDGNGDGFADTTYTSSDRNIIDKYPLIKVIIPVANFSTNVTGGTVPLTVQFTDLSQNTEYRIWDFGDGTTSIEQNPQHTYSTVGTYNVNLTVNNKNDTVSKFATITVSEQPVPPVLPVADFNSNLVSGFAPLDVQFTDASQNATGWNWDFGDGYTSTEQNPEHTFFTAGTHLVSLIVNNVNGTASKGTTITVIEQSSSGGGSSSGSSGSAGSSPEPQSNVEIKEISQTFISSGTSARFEFSQKVTPVVYVSFDSKKTAGKTTTIAEMLKGKSTLVSGLPSDDVYKYLNLWVGNSGFATSKNIENAAVCFKVEKAWVQDKKIDKSSITLNRYSDKTWNQLPTSLSSEDDKYMYFAAETPGFSPFAITGKMTASGTGIQPTTGNKTQPVSVNETQTKPNTGNTPANVELTPGQKENPSSSGTGSTKMPGFDMVIVIGSLLVVFLHKRK
jgi:PGF-pre-PGF domain-containing protein